MSGYGIMCHTHTRIYLLNQYLRKMTLFFQYLINVTVCGDSKGALLDLKKSKTFPAHLTRYMSGFNL